MGAGPLPVQGFKKFRIVLHLVRGGPLGRIRNESHGVRMRRRVDTVANDVGVVSFDSLDEMQGEFDGTDS